MSNDPRKAMQLIGGVEPSREQIQRVQAIAHSLGIGENDAMLPILIALETYHSSFSTMPKQAADIAGNLLGKFKETAEMQHRSAVSQANTLMQKTVGELVKDLAPTVQKTLAAAVSDGQTKERWQWIMAGAAVATIALALFGWIVHTTGFKAGFAAGVLEGQQQVSPSAATPGRAALPNAAKK